MVFNPRSKVHDAVEDWSMVVVIGMGKGSAGRMILESMCTLNLAFSSPRVSQQGRSREKMSLGRQSRQHEASNPISVKRDLRKNDEFIPLSFAALNTPQPPQNPLQATQEVLLHLSSSHPAQIL